MDPVTVTLLGFSLSVDAFAVSIAISFCVVALSFLRIFKVAGSFGLFQAMMPLFGWLSASSFAGTIKPWAHWVAFLLLSAVGVHMILEGVKKKTACPAWPDPTTGKALLALSVGTSIDAFAAGVGFVGMGIHVAGTVTVIGVMTFGLSVAAMLFGRKIGRNFGEKMLIIGGILLVTIGLKILFEHVPIVEA
ncbi:MAG: manganese efflux pump MntP family protein [Thermovirgaceae bacterium]